MPKNVAQWTGMAVTMIVVLGRDQDVFTAVPLGISAGLLATLFAMGIRQSTLARMGQRMGQGAVEAVAKRPRPKRRHTEIVLADAPR